MRTRTSVWCGLVAVLSISAAGCGSDDPSARPGASTAPTAVALDASWADEPWLLGFNTEGGAEGETVHAVYIRFTPSTGATTVRELPGLTTRDTYSEDQALMVSADEQYALLDSRVTAADGRRGGVTLYPIDRNETVAIDVRGWSKAADLVPVGVAFDPVEGSVLRVVDNLRRVWRVDLAARTAVPDGDLPSHAGWFFANGFDKNTGLPYIEAPDSSETLPAGNGDDDVRPVERRDGTIRSADGVEVAAGVPALPCGFSGGFLTGDGTYWLFCADTPRLSAYRLPAGGTAWEKIGTESKAVVPDTAEEVPVVLPPVSSPGD